MEKHPNSCICFVCGIENPMGLKLKFYAGSEDRRIAYLSSCRLMFDNIDIDRYNVIWPNID
jgi:hypothetical protein